MDEAEVAIAKQELAIRTSTLGSLRSKELNQAEINALMADENALLAIASARNKEVVASSLLTGVNMSKARQEAMVFFREWAAGNIRASTLSSLIGSLGPALTVAGIAAYSLFEVF
jgi:hypothetical protein